MEMEENEVGVLGIGCSSCCSLDYCCFSSLPSLLTISIAAPSGLEYEQDNHLICITITIKLDIN